MISEVPYRQFQIDGALLELKTIGSGHINDTWLAVFEEEGRTQAYVVQRINHLVFPDPQAVMDNMLRVTRHIQGKLAETPDRHRRVLRVIPTLDGGSCYRDEGGNFWRACPHIGQATTYDLVERQEQARQAAYAYGRFQQMLLDLEGPPLHETIPGFHSGPGRLAALRAAITRDPHNRAAEAAASIAFIEARAHVFDHLEALVAKGHLPQRTTHNDTKLNNVLLDDATGEGLCVIDLDTVMPGLTLYDFGDLVRSCATTGHEDERNLDLVRFDFQIFEALLRGYLDASGCFLVEAERENLCFSGMRMTLIIGARFLTDHLLGDQYFKIQRPGHNLDRALAHFALVRSMEQQYEAMNRLATGIFAALGLSKN